MTGETPGLDQPDEVLVRIELWGQRCQEYPAPLVCLCQGQRGTTTITVFGPGGSPGVVHAAELLAYVERSLLPSLRATVAARRAGRRGPELELRPDVIDGLGGGS